AATPAASCRCPRPDYSALSDSSQGIGVSLGSPLPTSHSPSHPTGNLPCSAWTTPTERGRWRVPLGPVRALRLPSIPMGQDRFTHVPKANRLPRSALVLTVTRIP